MVHRCHYLCPYQYHCFRSSFWFLLTDHFCPRVEFALTEWLSSFTGWSVRYSVILWESKVTPEERFRTVLSSVLPAKVKETDRQTPDEETPENTLDLVSLWAEWGVCTFEEKYPGKIGFLASQCKTTFRNHHPWPETHGRHNSCAVVSPSKGQTMSHMQ